MERFWKPVLVKTEMDLVELPIGEGTAGRRRAARMVVMWEGVPVKLYKGVGWLVLVGALKMGGGRERFCWDFSTTWWGVNEWFLIEHEGGTLTVFEGKVCTAHLQVLADIVRGDMRQSAA